MVLGQIEVQSIKTKDKSISDQDLTKTKILKVECTEMV